MKSPYSKSPVSSGTGHEERPLISFVIPAWNGSNYVAHAMRTVLDIDRDDLELIVSVDRSVDDTSSVARSIKDPRLTVIDQPERLSMAGHYERCLRMGSGRWISILGQDDGVLPDIMEQIDSILSQYPNADAIHFRRAYFFWPGCEALYGNKRLLYEGDTNVYVQGGERLVMGALRGTIEHYDLPQTYTNGLIKRSLVQDITQLSGGRFYQDPTPDVYSGFAVALKAQCIVRSERPAFWTGSSPRSTGFSISNSIGPSQPDGLSRQIAKDHFDAARDAGYTFSQVVPAELWKAASNSSLYAIAALTRVPYGSPRLRSKQVVELAYASFSARIRLERLGLFSHSTPRESKALADRQVSALGLRKHQIQVFSLLLLPRQAVSRLWHIVRRHSSKYRISIDLGGLTTPGEIPETLSEATNLIAHKISA